MWLGPWDLGAEARTRDGATNDGGIKEVENEAEFGITYWLLQEMPSKAFHAHTNKNFVL
jgi:hypothetical protein